MPELCFIGEKDLMREISITYMMLWRCMQVLGQIDSESLQIQCVSKEIQSFAIENYSEMFGHINTGRVNIWIHRDIEGKMWFGV